MVSNKKNLVNLEEVLAILNKVVGNDNYTILNFDVEKATSTSAVPGEEPGAYNSIQRVGVSIVFTEEV